MIWGYHYFRKHPHIYIYIQNNRHVNCSGTFDGKKSCTTSRKLSQQNQDIIPCSTGDCRSSATSRIVSSLSGPPQQLDDSKYPLNHRSKNHLNISQQQHENLPNSQTIIYISMIQQSSSNWVGVLQISDIPRCPTGLKYLPTFTIKFRSIHVSKYTIVPWIHMGSGQL